MKKMIGLISLLLMLWACKNGGEASALADSLVLNQYLDIEQSKQICKGPKQLYVELDKIKNTKEIKWRIEEPLSMHYMVSIDGSPYSSIPNNVLKLSANKDWYLFNLLPNSLNKVCIIAVCTEYQNGFLVPLPSEEICHFFIPETQLEDLTMDIVVE